MTNIANGKRVLEIAGELGISDYVNNKKLGVYSCVKKNLRLRALYSKHARLRKGIIYAYTLGWKNAELHTNQSA